MSISEIESILQSLRTRHPDLDEKMLEVLLLAGGWDSSIIRDTLLLFKTGQKNISSGVEKAATFNGVVPSPVKAIVEKSEEKIENKDVVSAAVTINQEEVLPPLVETNDLVYITNDGKEEGQLVSDNKTPEEFRRKEDEPQKITSHVEVINDSLKDVSVNVVESTVSDNQNKKEKSTESLIHPVAVTERNKEVEIPGNLPLKPFESTPHVWSFSKYNDVFYGEVMPPVTIEEKYRRHTPTVEHFSLEKEPLNKKDEGLVLLAGSMLLVIILLLGYMYSNGRI